MNETMFIVKGTCNGNWGDICVLTVVDLCQLPPVGQSLIYISPHTAHTLDDFAPNGWEGMKLHELTEIMWQKDVHFAQNLNKIQLAVPEEGSEEYRMLWGCELQVNEDHDCYQKDVTHVYAQNHYCDEWNNKRITSLQGDRFECVAFDSKKDHYTELTTIDVSLKPQKTGNLRKVLHVKVGARVILTTNIDVSDGLTNGTVGTVKYVINEEITKRVKVILVEFDNRDVGQEANPKGLYKHINSKAVPICKTQAIFPVNGKTTFQASQTQFPLVLAWAITIHKCQGLTLPEIAVDMTPSKGHYTFGQAYVAFSRVTQCDKLHIIKYTRKQIHVSQHAEKEMERLCKNTLPPMPECLFDLIKKQIYLLHLNIGNLKIRLKDIEIDTIMKSANIISLNKTHFVQKDTLTPKMMGITQNVSIFQHDHNMQ